MKCVAKEGSYGMKVCQDQREDYMECLHHTKLVRFVISLRIFNIPMPPSIHLYIYTCSIGDWKPLDCKKRNL